MRKTKSLDQVCEKLITMGRQLVEYTFPQAPQQLENSIFPWRLEETIVDGYYVVLHYTYLLHEDGFFVESIQIHGKHDPFLPFHVVVKIAQRFLGTNNLSLLELFKENRKIYCWSCFLDKDGKVLEPQTGSDYQAHVFEGFRYNYVDSSQIHLS